jgi:oxygen-independent coproporphyrinogen-3 oxidase
MLSPTHLRRLFEGLHGALDLSMTSETTLEANPATFTTRTAGIYRDLGITRVSLGAQSFHPGQLSTLGREHTAHDIVESAERLREAGIPSVNIDLIFSVPGQTEEDWEETLQAALKLQPEHISAYNLTYEEDTAFMERFGSDDYSDDPDRNAAMFTLAHDLLGGHGFRHYETSNYATPGHRSLHNTAYWEGADYLGLGPSAVSTIDGTRTTNVPDTSRYMSMIDTVGHAATEAEEITPEAFDLERFALMLRMEEGVPEKHLAGAHPGRVADLIEEGLAERSGDRLRLVGRGPLLVDSIVSHLLA